MSELDTYIGIILVSAFNKRKSQKDYWINDLFLSSDVKSAMDEQCNDKVWRVSHAMNVFCKNIKLLLYFQTTLFIDEMAANCYAKISMKQFIRGKPIRF